MTMLADKCIFVTGASGGVGGAIARACAREGAFVGVGYYGGEEAAQAEHDRIVDHGGRAEVFAIDVRDEDSVAQAVKAFAAWAPGGRIDGWVNCAGVVKPGLLVSSDVDALRMQLEVNLMGPLLCARAVLPRMMRQRRGMQMFGVLLNVGSVAAVRPLRGQAAYAASKGGLEALTRALAVEYARKGIRAVCLRLGAVDTDMLASTRVLAGDEMVAHNPQRRIATGYEVAEYACFLLSDKAGYTTGSCFTVDGGYLVG